MRDNLCLFVVIVFPPCQRTICIHSGGSIASTNVPVERVFVLMNDTEVMTKQNESTTREQNKKESRAVKMKHPL